MNRKKHYLLAELLICFSGVSFLLAWLGYLVFSHSLPVFPVATALIILVGFAGLIGLLGVTQLAFSLLFENTSAVRPYIYFFVYIGIGASLLPTLAGLFSGHLLLTIIGSSPILSAIHLTYLSKISQINCNRNRAIEPSEFTVDRWFESRQTLKSFMFSLFFMVAAPTACLSTWLLARELALVWYGLSLEEKATKSAEKIANGANYCLVESKGAETFEELDKRTIISKAFDNHFGRSSIEIGFSIREPHFGIKVKDALYYWSFREGYFKQLPSYAGSKKCTKDIGSSFFGVNVSKPQLPILPL